MRPKKVAEIIKETPPENSDDVGGNKHTEDYLRPEESMKNFVSVKDPETKYARRAKKGEIGAEYIAARENQGVEEGEEYDAKASEKRYMEKSGKEATTRFAIGENEKYHLLTEKEYQDSEFSGGEDLDDKIDRILEIERRINKPLTEKQKGIIFGTEIMEENKDILNDFFEDVENEAGEEGRRKELLKESEEKFFSQLSPLERNLLQSHMREVYNKYNFGSENWNALPRGKKEFLKNEKTKELKGIWEKFFAPKRKFWELGQKISYLDRGKWHRRNPKEICDFELQAIKNKRFKGPREWFRMKRSERREYKEQTEMELKNFKMKFWTDYKDWEKEKGKRSKPSFVRYTVSEKNEKEEAA